VSRYQRGLLLRLILGILGFALAFSSIFLSSDLSFPRPDFDTSSSPQDSSSPGWGDDSYESGGGWDSGGGSDSSWDSGSDGWDSGGGDGGSWDSGGGDSGSW
jgi:hypothetical protein